MPRAMRKYFSLLLLLAFFCYSCQDALVYSEYRATSNGRWNADEIMEFEITGIDSTLVSNMFINVRNDETFAFSNLFLITEFELPNGETTKDTLEYEMAKPDGEWLGSGHGSIKENKLWYKENVVFRDTGVYKVRVAHAMRKNGEVNGIEALMGITDVGLAIEKKEQY